MRIGLKIILFLAVAAVCVGGLWFFFYERTFTPASIVRPSYEDISVAPASPPGKFTDVYRKGRGTVVIDLAHDNNFTLAEINTLTLRIVSRGSGIEYLQKEGQEAKTPVSKQLEEKLRFADVLVVILPGDSYSEDERRLVREFVNKGCRLLLVAEPTRDSSTNSLASDFGLVFESGYLYNVTENEGNFRNILVTQFVTNELTKNLKKVVLYTAGHISPTASGIAFADENTFASITGLKGNPSPVALSSNSRVLAISDFTFMTEPHSAVYDNNQFISNIADWLVTSERAFHLSDFPYFLKEAPLVTYADVSMLRTGIELNNLLVELGKNPRVVKYEESTSLSQDTVFIGLFKDVAKVGRFLERGNIITTDTSIELPGIRTMPQAGTSIIYLYKEGGKHLLVILADAQKRLQETKDLLKTGEFRQWLVSDTLAIYQPADFSLSANPSTISFTSGGSATFNVSIVPSGGFVGTVRLTSASTPAGLTITPASTDVISPYPTTTFTVSSATPGAYTVTITGTSGTLTNTTTVAVTVSARSER